MVGAAFGLKKNGKGNILGDNRPGTYIIEWRENGRRLRKSAGFEKERP
jgi:hypothetical protein